MPLKQKTRPPAGKRRKRVPTARVTEKIYTPVNAAQEIIWNSKAKITAAVSGHFGGKSHLGAYWLMDQAFDFPGYDFIVCGPTYNNLQNSAIPKLRSLFALHGLPWEYDQHAKVGFRSQNKEYWLPGGGVIYFRSADRPGSMQGAHVKAFWMDEVVDTTFYVYETLRGRIAGLNGRGLITSTPYDRGWLYEHVYLPWKLMVEKGQTDNPQFCVAQWKSIDNPIFPKEEWESMQAMLPLWRFRMLYEGQFERPMGLVYDSFQDKHFIQPFDIPSDWPRILGIDWGFKDPLACIWLAKAPDGRLIAYDEYYQSGWMRYETREQTGAPKGAQSMPQEMVDEIIERCIQRGELPAAVYCDSADPDMVLWTKDRFDEKMDFNRVYGAAKGPGSVMSGIQRNYMTVKADKFLVFNTLLNFKDEVERYSWETDKITGEPLDKAAPVDRNNHLMDAWRYAFAGSPDEPHNSFGFGRLDPWSPFGRRELYRAA